MSDIIVARSLPSLPHAISARKCHDSVRIVTIDEKEYLRLGLLLEQTFPEGNAQMVSSVINRKGVVRTNELTRTDQFYPIFVGADSGRIESIGKSLPAGVDRSTIADKPGCLTVWPLKPTVPR